MTRRWHYTKGLHIPRLLRTGYIHTTLAGDAPGERRAVWASSNWVWETTTAPSVGVNETYRWVSDMMEAAQLVGGLFRIELEPEAVPYTWSQYRTLSGLPQEQLRGLEISARKHRARLQDWWVGFEPVPREQWRLIERWDAETDTWKQIDMWKAFAMGGV